MEYLDKLKLTNLRNNLSIILILVNLPALINKLSPFSNLLKKKHKIFILKSLNLLSNLPLNC